MYTDFANVYDVMMHDVNYAAWADYLSGLLAQNWVKPGAFCVECACGTGSLTIPLYQKGYKMLGIDLSDQMLSAAMRKSREQGCTIPFIRQDMARLAIGKKADAILATCDGLNYLHPQKAERFFAAASSQLRSGGVLIFDVSTPWKLQNVLGDHTLTYTEDSFSYIWENRWNPASHAVELHVTAFVRQPNNMYMRVVENQVQYAHEKDFLRETLKQNGYEDVCFYGGQTMQPPKEDCERWHITARKP